MKNQQDDFKVILAYRKAPGEYPAFAVGNTKNPPLVTQPPGSPLWLPCDERSPYCSGPKEDLVERDDPKMNCYGFNSLDVAMKRVIMHYLSPSGMGHESHGALEGANYQFVFMHEDGERQKVLHEDMFLLPGEKRTPKEIEFLLNDGPNELYDPDEGKPYVPVQEPQAYLSKHQEKAADELTSRVARKDK